MLPRAANGDIVSVSRFNWIDVMPSKKHLAAALDRYIDYWNTISPETVDQIRDLGADNMRFRDPFTDVQGMDKVPGVFAEMFEQVPDIAFSFEHSALDGHVGLITWEMTFTVDRRGMKARVWTIPAASRITFDDEGKVVDHFDFWDATPLFESVPIVGGLVRLVKRFMT